MKTSDRSFTAATHRTARMGTFSSLLLVALFLAACTSPVGPELDAPGDPCVADPAAAGCTPPPAAQAKQYKVRIDLHRIKVIGDCETDPVVKIAGQFAYRVSVSEQQKGGGWSSQAIVTQTADYGSKNGSTKKAYSGDNMHLNRTYQTVLEEGLNYKVHLRVIEWDGSKKDHRMDGSVVVEENDTGGKLSYEHKLTLGSNNACKVHLYFDAKESLIG